MVETPEQRLRRILATAAAEELEQKIEERAPVTVAEAMKQLLLRPGHTVMRAMDEENGVAFDVTNIDFEPHSPDDSRPDIVWIYMKESA